MSKNRELAELGDKVTVDSGNVGIGTSSPTTYSSTGLVLNGSSTTSCIKMANSSTGSTQGAGFDFEMNGSDINYVNRTASGSQKFWTNSTERMRINSSGQAHISGTNGGYYATSPVLNMRGGDSTMASAAVEIFTGYATTTKYAMVFCNGNGTIGGIYTNGTSTTYVTSSDYRLKENVVDMEGAIDRVKALQPKRFNFIADADTTVDGFLAHEVSDIVPEAISGEKDAVETRKVLVSEEVLDDDGNVVEEAVFETSEQPSYQAIDQSKLVPLLTGALQEAIAKIETLETTVADLTTRIEALENV